MLILFIVDIITVIGHWDLGTRGAGKEGGGRIRISTVTDFSERFKACTQCLTKG